jgi:hypothetical protein
MAVMENTRNLKTWTGAYDFTVDGGATSTIVLRSNDGPIPIGAVVVSGFLALQVEGAADILAATAQASLTTGRKSIIPAATGATAVKTTASRSPAMVIATAAFTAGQFSLTLMYR